MVVIKDEGVSISMVKRLVTRLLEEKERMKLTAEERKARRVFDKAVRRWYNILLIDPIWTVGVVVDEDETMEHGDAYVDIGTAEYYVANVHISRSLLSMSSKKLEKVAQRVACHELLHITTADFQRAALVAVGDNEKMREELRYRYEQLVSKLSMILMDLTEEEADARPNGKGFRTPTEVLPVSEVPTGDEDCGGI